MCQKQTNVLLICLLRCDKGIKLLTQLPIVILKRFFNGYALQLLFFAGRAMTQEIRQDRLETQEAGDMGIRTEQSPLHRFLYYVAQTIKRQNCYCWLLFEIA